MAGILEGIGPRLGRRLLIAMFLGSMVAASAARAQVADGGAAEGRQSIIALYAAIKNAMHTGGSFRQRFDLLAPVVDKVFDLNAILQTSVGLRWASLDEASRQTLFTVFRAFTIASYTANFDKDGGERFEVLPQTRMSGSDVIVESNLIPLDSDPIRIDYVTRGGRVVDVLLDGSISRVAVQRSDFRSLLASGTPGPLIDSLKRKVSDLSGGTMTAGP